MSITQYVGNCADLLDWEHVLAHLEDREQGMFVDCSEHTFRKRSLKLGPERSKHDLENLQTWIDNRYDLSAADFTAYRPGIHFDKSIAEKYCEYLGITFNNVWITRVDPGCTVPTHFDIYPHADTTRPYERYMTFISPPAVGQIFIVDNVAYHNIPVGETYRWSKTTAYHSSANTGFKPSFIIHAEGAIIGEQSNTVY